MVHNDNVSKFLSDVVRRGLREAVKRGVSIYTVALYYDHEGRAVSLCVDTRENSRRCVEEQNEWRTSRFLRGVQAGDLSLAQEAEANIGRNLELGDFAAVNLARSEVPRGLEIWSDRRLGAIILARELVAFHDEVRALSGDAKETVLACSGPDAEVDLVWALP